ncbi:MAG: prolipoprotein diacylglyceryl transferase [Alphaproteobacteria bacterium]|nr:prolipoprotein diacylglyceryl transferase [Alphaproteobacteria bacterium]
MTGIQFPDIDPIAIHFTATFGIRWYALAYLAGFLGGWFYSGRLADFDRDRLPKREDIDNVLPLLVLGIILGGRIGYVLFYNLDYYLKNPINIPFIWEGGMSFHGGLIGVVAVCAIYARRRGFSPLALGDILAVVAPIGLFFGRIANFINGELFGRVTTVSWAVIFPYGGGLPRHPSQLYEAFLEGLCLFVILFLAARNPDIRRTPGVLLGIFIAGYGISRFIVEFYREPDPQVGLILQYFSLGQLLSFPMIFAGIFLVWHVRKLGDCSR